MRKRSAVMVLASAAALVVAGPQAALAAGPTDLRPLANCTAGVLCGNVTNRDDRYQLLITTHWPGHRERSTWRVLRPGQDGPDVGVKDVDGLWVGPGCTAELAWGVNTVGPGWHRVRGLQNIQVTDIRC